MVAQLLPLLLGDTQGVILVPVMDHFEVIKHLASPESSIA